MKKNKQFGETVKGHTIPVINNREVRATAGIMFLMAFIALIIILNKVNFVPIKYVLSIFLLEFSIRLFMSPKYAPLLIIGRAIVSNQNPEFVGAEQKKFAWYIGFIISLLMFILLVLVNAYSPITGFACLICLLLMFSESAFGICVGCKLYGIIKKEKAQHCPGEICDANQKYDIQKVSQKQWTAVVILLLFIVLLYVFFQNTFSQLPHNLFQ